MKTLLSFESGELNFNKLYEYVFKIKVEIKRIKDNLGESEHAETVKMSFEKFEILLNEFLEKNLTGELSALYFKKYIVSLALEDIRLRNYLTNL